MTSGQVANGIGSAVAMVTSGTFIIVWTIYGQWYKTSTGRFMVMKAGAICLTGVITVWLTLTDFQSEWDPLRYVQAGLWGAVSIAFIQHTITLWKINRAKGNK